ncbi:hypothetical protein DPEC_G00141330 [Dallia pectoralis]|uniref:Uncharacterized protein n=1 Tax=Dallia pectoralis TaxID=75939 RepID=A0ACC2GMS8_DALPE|nr:hypothetical protein DPEC_G00141330 [Dallia pectoralis]
MSPAVAQSEAGHGLQRAGLDNFSISKVNRCSQDYGAAMDRWHPKKTKRRKRFQNPHALFKQSKLLPKGKKRCPPLRELIDNDTQAGQPSSVWWTDYATYRTADTVVDASSLSDYKVSSRSA